MVTQLTKKKSTKRTLTHVFSNHCEICIKKKKKKIEIGSFPFSSRELAGSFHWRLAREVSILLQVIEVAINTNSDLFSFFHQFLMCTGWTRVGNLGNLALFWMPERYAL